MPTVITHAAVPLCIGLGLGSKVIPPRLLFAGIILAMLPDADVLSLLSHSLLDSVTTGGKGVGWLWPWSDERFFAPWQVIKVAPFALSRYTTPYGHQVIISELMWVWLPGMLLMGMLWWRRR